MPALGWVLEAFGHVYFGGMLGVAPSLGAVLYGSCALAAGRSVTKFWVILGERRKEKRGNTSISLSLLLPRLGVSLSRGIPPVRGTDRLQVPSKLTSPSCVLVFFSGELMKCLIYSCFPQLSPTAAFPQSSTEPAETPRASSKGAPAPCRTHSLAGTSWEFLPSSAGSCL